MAKKKPFKKLEVEEGYMIADGKRILLSKITVSYALNNIPTATVVPALGRNLKKRAQDNNVESLVEGAKAEVYLKTSNGTDMLLRGYISGISGSDNSGLFKRTLSMVVYIKGVATVLAKSPAQSVMFTEDKKSSTLQIARIVKSQWFGNQLKADDKGALNASAIFINRTLKAVGKNMDPSKIIISIFEGIAESWAGDNTDIEGVLTTLGVPVDFAVSVHQYIQSIGTQYMTNWYKSNALEGIKQAANSTFLALVPYNKGFILGNPTSLKRGADISLTTDEYLAIKVQVSDDLIEPVDGIFMQNPLAPASSTALITFPETSGRVGVGKYYHQRFAPNWALPIWENNNVGSIRNLEKGKRSLLALNPSNDKITKGEFMSTFLLRVAKVEYARAKMKKASASIKLPYRTDLMPGTIVKLEVSGEEDLSFFGSKQQYGMIVESSIECDLMSDSGTLNTHIVVTSMRSEEDNKNDDLTFEGHPLYSKEWKGIDITGKAL